MANDLAQLIFNVIAITGLTSLAVICRMLKRDNEKLTVELRERNGHTLKIRTRRMPRASVLAKRPASPEEDIRQYVSRRMDKWIEIQQAGAKA
jgi:hypothetical protein